MTLPRIPGIALERLLGSGGMGAVYSGLREADGARVAVKVLLQANPSAAVQKRFEREARAMTSLRHPNVCAAYSFGAVAGGRLYLVMEEMSGQDLGERLEARGRLALAEVTEIGVQAAAGLAAAHAIGVVHRDIKPSNLFLHVTPDGQRVTKVLDFGLAVAAVGDARETRVTRTGDVVGTPAYMAPEQARGEKREDARTDVYALGAVLYAALTGGPPHGAGSMLEVLVRALTEEPVPLVEARPGVPAALAAPIMAALSREPEARPPDMVTFGARLAAAVGSDPGARVQDSGWVPPSGRSEAVTLQNEQRVLTVLLATAVRDVERVLAAVRAQGGDARDLGTGQVVGLFGGEAREGREAERAVRAALTAEPVCGTVAVGTGHAVGRRGHFAGEALNRAEGLTHVLAGGVMLDAETRRRVSGRFVMDGDRAVSELAAGTPASTVAGLPFLGRDAELSDLRERVIGAFDDEEPFCALVTGPSGIGRTRLLREVAVGVAVAEPETLVVSLDADRGHRYHAWWLMGAAVRRWAGAADDGAVARLAEAASLGEEGAAFLGVAMGRPLRARVSPVVDSARRDAQVMADQMVQVFGDLLEWLCERQPVLLMVDDLHWGDTPSLWAMEVLLSRLDVSRFALVAAGRLEAADGRAELFESPDVHRVALRELSRRAALELVEAVGLSEAVAAELAAHAGGNPLFLEEMARAAAAGELAGRAEGAGFVLPMTVEEAIQGRLDLLSPGERTVLKLAAAFGASFPREGLEALGVSGAGAHLARLRREKLVSPARRRGAGRFENHGFRVGVVREVAYGMLTEAQRIRVHGRIGAWLEAQRVGTAAERAEHWEAAGEMARAARRWAEASEAAERAGDLRGALEALERAGDQTEYRLRKVLLALRAGDVTAAGVAADGLMARVGELSERQRGHLLYARGSVLCARAEYGEAAGALGEARRIWEAVGDSGERSRVLAARAVAVALAGEAGARADALEAFECAGGARDRAVALQTLSYVASLAGDREAEGRFAAEAAAVCAEAGDVRRGVEVEVVLAVQDQRVGRFGEAAVRLRGAVQASQRIGAASTEAWARVNLGYCLWRAGDVGLALEALNRAMGMGEWLGSAHLVGAAGIYRSLARLSTDVRAARADAEAAVLRVGGSPLEPSARAALALAWLMVGEAAEALRETERALAQKAAVGMAELALELLVAHGDALLGVGRLREAAAARGEARALLEEEAAGLSGGDLERFLGSTEARRRVWGETVVGED